MPDDSDISCTARGKLVLGIAAGVCLLAGVILSQWDQQFVWDDVTGRLHPTYVLLSLVTDLGHGVSLGVGLLVLMVFFAQYRTGAAGAIALLWAAVAANGLKALVGRVRPNGTSGAFPSAHTAVVFAVAVVLAHRFPRWKYAFYGVALAVGATRVLRGKHFVSDVLGGIAVGLLLGLLAVAVAGYLPDLGADVWCRRVAVIALLVLIVYAYLGRDRPQILAQNVGPAVCLLLVRRASRIVEPFIHHAQTEPG